MTNTILLILWLAAPAEQAPVFQVLTTVDTMKECGAVRHQLIKQAPEAENKVVCVQWLNPLEDAGSSF